MTVAPLSAHEELARSTYVKMTKWTTVPFSFHDLESYSDKALHRLNEIFTLQLKSGYRHEVLKLAALSAARKLGEQYVMDALDYAPQLLEHLNAAQVWTLPPESHLLALTHYRRNRWIPEGDCNGPDPRITNLLIASLRLMEGLKLHPHSNTNKSKGYPFIEKKEWWIFQTKFFALRHKWFAQMIFEHPEATERIISVVCERGVADRTMVREVLRSEPALANGAL